LPFGLLLRKLSQAVFVSFLLAYWFACFVHIWLQVIVACWQCFVHARIVVIWPGR
jgi:hypothetical protein